MTDALTPEILIKYSNYVNYTFCLNQYNFLFEIRLQNISKALENLQIEIASSLGIIEKHTLFIDKVSEDSYLLNHFDFIYNLSLLRSLTEKDLDSITITVLSDGIEVMATQFSISVLPLDYFGGLRVHPELLCSYVTPNHPSIYQIKSDTVTILEQNNFSPSFEAYQSGNKERVLQMVSSLYKAIQNQQIVYSAMPPSFEVEGQRIRFAEQIIDTKFGNCIDISLLFAACLEAIDLNPIIIITKGHAFVGVWLEDLRFDAMLNFDRTALTKRLASGIKEIAVIETTSLCKSHNIPFSQAMTSAEIQLMNETDFQVSFDIKNARSNSVLPISILKKDNKIKKESITELKDDFFIDDNYDLGEKYDTLDLVDDSKLSKQKIWERKLLDLSLRNSLLNLRFTKSMLQIIDLKINLLEDTLADGKTFTIHPDNNQPITRRYNNYIAPLHPSVELFRHADDEFKYNKLLTTYHNDDLDSILTNLYRTSKLAEEENGKSTLYLGLGLLKWYDPKNKTTPRLAPILLVPVELSRRSVNSKFTLRSREEDSMINITLIEYLKQEFHLNLNALETLPIDDSGVDVPKVLAIFRKAILNLEGWDILDQIVLGIFSFNKLILWQDLSKYSEEIQKSPIVKSLIEAQLSQEFEPEDSNDLELEDLPSATLTLPIPADNSQLTAVNNAHHNKTFILHGPPGTGKSQTITNIIADALANDKKVLFVAAKKAALDVVHKRLEQIGLAPFCLELHSNKSKKSDVLKQFEDALSTPKYQLTKDFLEEAERLDNRKNDLNKYIVHLHNKNQIGWSLYNSASFLELNNIAFSDVEIINYDLKELTPQQWNSWQDWMVTFSPIAAQIGIPSDHPLALVSLDSHQFNQQSDFSNTIQRYIEAHDKLNNNFNKYHLDVQQSLAYTDLFNFINETKLQTQLFSVYNNLEQKANFNNWIDSQTQLQHLEISITSKFNKSILSKDIEALQHLWNQSKYTWFLPKWLKQREVKKQIQAYANFKVESEEHINYLFQQLQQYKEEQAKLTSPRYTEFESLKNNYLENDFLQIDRLKKDWTTWEVLEKWIVKTPIENPENWMRESFITNSIKDDIDTIIANLKEYNVTEQQLSTYLFTIPNIEHLQKIKKNLPLLENWINYTIYKSKAKEIDLDWFIHLLENGKLNPQSLPQELDKIMHFNHFIQVSYASEVITRFDATIYESLIQQYKTLHSEFVEISKNKLIAKLSSGIPNLSHEAAQSSEIGFLQKAIRSKGRGLSIRRLFDQIPTLIPRLKPCMLMSPISVAQYFDVSTDHFDLVIFDEASQLPTSEAISALARAKQAIIVGDPKQMPPTSFFSSSKVDEDNIEMEDLESILEDCLALSIPSNYLLRHYRSKHESLISFSNKNFYDSKLLTFPSPDDLNQKVSFDYVEGFYDKGKTRTNQNEAIAVVSYIKKHLHSKNKKSIGVVTFSQTQQTLIEDLLQKVYSENPLLEEFALSTDEPIFIKNLENVQGDERDIILFSIGYGPDEEHKISMNFGPLNREGGWRRLNVAVTRARYEMRVFSSLKGDQIDLNRTKSEGVKGLKDFLNFAEKGNYTLKTSHDAIAEPTLIDAIAQTLEHAGLQVRKNIGTSEYKVDLGIIHPDKNKEYILGILVDSENYYNIRTTNDRELLAPNVLHALTWNIHRIWTLDWLKNKDRIVHQILEKIEELKNAEQILIEEEPHEIENTLVELADNNDHNAKIPYVSAVLDCFPYSNSESIYFLESRAKLIHQFKEIIDVETPISKSYLFKKILKLWNTSRAGTKLNSHLSDILESIPTISKYDTHQTFYWNEAVTPDSLQNYRDNSLERRSIEDISQEEIKLVIMEIMNHNLSLSKDDLTRLTAKTFDFMKVGSQIDAVIHAAILNLIDANLISLENNRLKLQ